MLLNVYLGTTGISVAIMTVYKAFWKYKIKKEGYEFVDNQKVIDNASNYFMLFCPAINIIIATLTVIFGIDELYPIDKLLIEGKIKPIETNSIKVEETTNYQETLEKEITLEEKKANLQREREILMEIFKEAEKEQVLKRTLR